MKLKISSDREVVITRSFTAPRARVFEAITRVEDVRRWYGSRAFTLAVCESDLRVGGRWRYVLRAPDGSEHGFTGEYRAIVAPERIVRTEIYEAHGPDHAIDVTMAFIEDGAHTSLAITLAYQTQADRDGHLRSGMEPAMREAFDRLATLLG